MSNLLLMGKDLPDSLELSESFSKNNRQIFTTAKPEAEIANFESENIFSCICNRASAISAHSFILKGETKLRTFDEVLIVFDASLFAGKFNADRTEDISQAVDTMINNYLFFTNELLKRIDQCKDKILVSFLVKKHPSKHEILTNASKANVIPSSAIVNSSEAAFISLAQNFAANIIDRPYLSVFLAECPYSNESPNDSQIGDWLCSCFDTIKNAKHPMSIKQASSWYKTGSKFSLGFSLFK